MGHRKEIAERNGESDDRLGEVNLIVEPSKESVEKMSWGASPWDRILAQPGFADSEQIRSIVAP
jgi:hypothetical protein